MNERMVASSSLSGMTPMVRQSTSPRLNRMSVGTECTLYIPAIFEVLIHIHFDDAQAVAQRLFDVLQDRLHQLAWLAPCSEKVAKTSRSPAMTSLYFSISYIQIK
jgi:hypothetical protein